jgi:PIN domain nuclease of toxin-antitoxin system
MIKLLLDTHVVLFVVNDELDRLPASILELLTNTSTELYCSTATLWEIAIKVRLGKLAVSDALACLDQAIIAFNIKIFPILPRHVLTEVIPEPPTRDPFDRLLLAQARCEGLSLVTIDQSLTGHPLAWRVPTTIPRAPF